MLIKSHIFAPILFGYMFPKKLKAIIRPKSPFSKNNPPTSLVVR